MLHDEFQMFTSILNTNTQYHMMIAQNAVEFVHSFIDSFILIIRAFMQIHDRASCKSQLTRTTNSFAFCCREYREFSLLRPGKKFTLAGKMFYFFRRKMLSIEIPFGNPCLRIFIDSVIMVVVCIVQVRRSMRTMTNHQI